MKIISLSSGSHGNCYVISNDKGGDKIMIEAGLPPKKLKKALWKEDIMLKDISNCLISHEHLDHFKSANFLSNSSTNILLPKTHEDSPKIDSIRKDRRYYLTPGKIHDLGQYLVLPADMSHDDVTCLGFMIYYKPTEERIFYATDSMFVKQNPKDINYLMIEVNYQQKYLEEAIKEKQMTRENMRRVMRTHMGLDTALKFLDAIDLSKVKEIWILHVSSRNASKEEIKETIQKQTGKVVRIA